MRLIYAVFILLLSVPSFAIGFLARATVGSFVGGWREERRVAAWALRKEIEG